MLEVIDIPKGWLYDKGEGGSERKGGAQRHVANELA
jgi:hypothetical protein